MTTNKKPPSGADIQLNPGEPVTAGNPSEAKGSRGSFAADVAAANPLWI